MTKLWVKTFNHFICAKEAFEDMEQVKDFVKKVFHLSEAAVIKQRKKASIEGNWPGFSSEEIYKSVVICNFDDSEWNGKELLCLNELT